MKLKGLIAAAIIGASLMATAAASANVNTFYTPGQHVCHNRHGSLTASPYTSCAFGNSIDNYFWEGIDSGNCSRYDYKCGGSVWSSVTDRWYHVTCLPRDRPVTCYSNGRQSWIKFYPRY